MSELSGYVPNLETQKGPMGPLRDKYTVTIGTDDFVLDSGFICQIAAPASSGSITYRTLKGSTDQTEGSLSAGDTINVADVPVVLRAIRGSSTVTSVIVGII